MSPIRFLIQHRRGAETWSLRPTRSLRLVQGDRLEIGRGTGAVLRFVDPGIGERHATLYFEDGRYFVVDHGTATGTYLNGSKVVRSVIRAGDLLELAGRQIALGGGAPGDALELLVRAADDTDLATGETRATSTGSLLEEESEYDSEAPTLADVDLPSVPEEPEEASESESQPTGRPDTAALDVGPTVKLPAAPRPPSETPPAAASPPPPRQPQKPLQDATLEHPRHHRPLSAKAAEAEPRPVFRGLHRRYEIRPVDYLHAYGLRRAWLSKTTLSALCFGAAALGLSLVVLGERRDAFLPGPLSSAHDILSGPENCGACHIAWRGVASDRCRSCHQGAEHDLRQTREPECLECHVEHRSVPRLAEVDNQRCTDCHAAIELADDGEHRFARTITSFAGDHPDFSLTVGRDTANERRVPLAKAVADKLDRSVIDFNHRLHLDPSKIDQRILECADCHFEAPDTRRMTIVSYEQQCQSCHQLGFDRNEPPAPHAAPELVADHILATYAERRGSAPRSTGQRRLLIFRRNEKTLSVDERVERQAFSAAERLFKAACDKCHRLQDSELGFPPEVVPPGIPDSWLPYSEFDHSRHDRVGCEICHSGARTSIATADLLLAGIETCRPCHGGLDPADSSATLRADQLFGPTRASATTDCVACHLYHERTLGGHWASDRPGPDASDIPASAGDGG